MIVRYSSPTKSRQARIRRQLKSHSTRLRLSVFRSGRHIYAQIVDDAKGQTLVAASDKNITTKSPAPAKSSQQPPSAVNKSTPKIDTAKLVGELIAQTALKKDITKVVFDRGHYHYHGRVKALAEGARSGGLEF